ncbi:MAG: hypothetical protein ACI84K_000509 [Pseudohongiellaceae bacterium]|jgi:hypothetical protein
MTNKQQNTPANSEDKNTLTLLQTFKSVLSALLGVQSKENLVRDFSRGKASHFIFTGLVFVILFVLTLVLLVNLVLSFAL